MAGQARISLRPEAVIAPGFGSSNPVPLNDSANESPSGCAQPSARETKRYPYYLCQAKTCASYGKSIARDKLEGEFADIVKSLQPNKSLFSLIRVMFGDIWNHRLEQAQEVARNGERDLADVDKQIESLLTRILAASSDVVIRTYEQKIGELEKSKARLQETLANRIPPKGRFDEILELSL